MNVFEKLHGAGQNATGVDLTASDVNLLLESAGDAITEAEVDYEKWREIFDECERLDQKASSS